MTMLAAATAAPDLVPPDVGTFCPGTDNLVVHKWALKLDGGVAFECPCGQPLTFEQALSMTR